MTTGTSYSKYPVTCPTCRKRLKNRHAAHKHYKKTKKYSTCISNEELFKLLSPDEQAIQIIVEFHIIALDRQLKETNEAVKNKTFTIY